MKNSESKSKITGFFKNVSDRLKGKEPVKKIDTSEMSEKDFCEKVLSELGGLGNLLLIDSCITRLRLKVLDLKKINSKNLEALGSDGIINVGSNTVHIIFGEKAVVLEKYYNNLKKELMKKA